MDIGERIRRRREELDMTQDELARAAGYKSSYAPALPLKTRKQKGGYPPPFLLDRCA